MLALLALRPSLGSWHSAHSLMFILLTSPVLVCTPVGAACSCLLPSLPPSTPPCLQVMMKLRNARNLDARQSSLVDSAYFAVKVRWSSGSCSQVSLFGHASVQVDFQSCYLCRPSCSFPSSVPACGHASAGGGPCCEAQAAAAAARVHPAPGV